MLDTDTAATIFRRRPEVSFTSFGDELLVVAPSLSWQIVLNGPAKRLFELLDGERSAGDLADALLEDCEEPLPPRDEVVADVLELLGDLESKGAVQRA